MKRPDFVTNTSQVDSAVCRASSTQNEYALRSSSPWPSCGFCKTSRRQRPVTTPRAAVVLSISRATAYDAVSRGEVPCIRIGRRILIPKVALERMLDGAGEGTQP